MTDDILPYYNNELAYLRHLGAEFAAAHPKVAGRLQLGPDSAKDPHVARFIEACAFLNARTRKKLDDEFPELAEAFLNVVAPQYLRPFPSAAIIKFRLAPQLADLVDGYEIELKTTIETESIEGQPCTFRTAYPTKVWPFEVESASYKGHPFQAPQCRYSGNADAVVRVDLETFSSQVTFDQIPCDRLRFFLRGPAAYVSDLYELLHNNTLGIAIAGENLQAGHVLLNRKQIQPVGFEPHESLFDPPQRHFWGYHLLSEYFALPEKFLFVDIVGIPAEARALAGNKLSLFFYLDRHISVLERHVSEETFQLACCPVINLFSKRAEPIALTHNQYEYHVVPDTRRVTANEVFSIDRVKGIAPSGEEIEFRPFYSVRHSGPENDAHAYWNAVRRRAGYAGGQVDYGTEMYLSLVDLEFSPNNPADWVLDVQTTCLNRDLPHRLPFGGGQPLLSSPEIGIPISITCLTPPTPTLRPSFREGNLWRLISHLSLNHLSLVGNNEGADTLREILQLYDMSESDETRKIIDSIMSVNSRRVVGRIGGEVAGGFCRGQEVQIQFDEERFAGAGVYLFASVLERFLGEYCSVNSFTKLIAKTNQREKPIRTWAPRASERILL